MVDVHICRYAHMSICTYVYTCPYSISMCTFLHLHTSTRAHTHTCIHTHMHTYTGDRARVTPERELDLFDRFDRSLFTMYQVYVHTPKP
jgi:hypothetical protein